MINSNTEKVLVLSTSHLPKNPDFGKAFEVRKHHGGWSVWLGWDDEEGTDDAPLWLMPILNKAWIDGCNRLDFHSEAERIEGLPIYR